MYPNESSYDQAFVEMHKNMQIFYCSGGNQPAEIVVGQPVAALFNDMQWYRAEVTDPPNQKNLCEVLYVDYGNIGEVDLKQVKELIPQFFKYEIQVNLFYTVVLILVSLSNYI